MRKASVLTFGLFVAAAGCAVPVSQGSADVDAVQGGGVAIRGAGTGGLHGGGGVAPVASGDDGGPGGGNANGGSGNGGEDAGGSSSSDGCNGMASPYFVSQLLSWQDADEMLRDLGTANAIALADALDATLAVSSTGVYIGVSDGVLTPNPNDDFLELLINPDEIAPSTLAGVEAAFAPAEEFDPPVSESRGSTSSCTLDRFGITATDPYAIYIYDPCSTCKGGDGNGGM